jgi:DNA repair ATPase RecN
MNNFGKIKDKILKKLTESYSKEDKPEVKKILKLIKENKDFRSLYLFYDGIEHLNMLDSTSAELYVESVSKILIEKMSLVKPICKRINEVVSDIQVDDNKLYEMSTNKLQLKDF